MTGWRLGWITAPAKLEVQFEKLTEYNVAGPPPFIQQAGITALCEGEDFIRESNGRYQKALSYFKEWSESQERIEFVAPNAAFYAFFQIRDGKDSLGMAKDLLNSNGVGLAQDVRLGHNMIPTFDFVSQLQFQNLKKDWIGWGSGLRV